MIFIILGFFLLLLIYRTNNIDQVGGSTINNNINNKLVAEGMECNKEIRCRAGLECFGKENNGVCIFPKDNTFAYE